MVWMGFFMMSWPDAAVYCALILGFFLYVIIDTWKH